jgi:multiple sugar transport system permease protein
MANRRKRQASVARERTLISEADLVKPHVKLLYWGVFAILLFGTLTTFLPLLWGFMGALKTPREIFSFPPTLFPRPALNPLGWQWTNYPEAGGVINYGRCFFNTFVLAVGVWFFQLVPSAMAGYAISKLRIPFLRVITMLFFASLMVPFQAILIPLYLTVVDVPIFHINLLLPTLGGGFLAIMLPAGVNAFNIFVFRTFFDQIPTDLIEAARIDGASEWRIFLSIVVPLSQSIIAVLTIFSFVTTWNDFMWPFIVLFSEKFWTIMVALYYLQKRGDVSANIVLAALMLSTIPPMVVFLIFQRRIMRGIALSGLKF